MKRLARWMSVVLPPFWMMGLAIALAATHFVLELGMSALISWKIDKSLALVEFPTNYAGTVALIMSGFAVWRVMAFHPGFRYNYAKWLKTTSWTASRPLPLGPAHLVWQDLIVVLVATIGCSATEHWQIAAPMFFFVYCMFLFLANAMAGVYWSTYASLALMSSLWLAVNHLWFAAAIGLALYVVCYFGFKQSLPSYSWTDSVRWELNMLKELASLRTTNWPRIDVSAFGKLQEWKESRHAWLLSLLIAWFAFCVSFRYLADCGIGDRLAFPRELPLWLFLFGWLCCSVRALLYCSKHWSPISLMGRLWTGRLIVPGYDRVFVAPLLALATSYVLPRWLIALAVPLPLVAALSVFVILAITSVMGPTLSDWQLTGEHRISSQKPGPKWIQL